MKSIAMIFSASKSDESVMPRRINILSEISWALYENLFVNFDFLPVFEVMGDDFGHEQ